MSENHDAIVVDAKTEGESGGCPVAHGRAPHPTQGGGNRQWWPERLNLKILAKNPAVANPLGEEFDYAEAFKSLDLAAVKRDIAEVLTDLAGLVAGRLRPLRPVHDPDGLAQRGHLPDQRRPRRRRGRASSASLPSTAGRTTGTSTRPAVCCGRSRRSTARTSRGPTS